MKFWMDYEQKWKKMWNRGSFMFAGMKKAGNTESTGRGTTGFCIWKGIQRVEKMVKLCNIVDNILYGYEPRNSTNPEKPLEIVLIKSYIITRKRNKIFGVGSKFINQKIPEIRRLQASLKWKKVGFTTNLRQMK